MDRIGRYKIVRELGRGAMGVVYHAIDPNIGRPVAIKTIQLSGGKPEELERLRERLFREARSAGILSHPGIVTIYDVEQQGDLAYIAMEFVDGVTLDQALSAAEALSPDRMFSILGQTAVALDYAHSKGIVHRDIKPANIMIADAMVKITDFGIAKITASEQFTMTGSIVGTPHYMSPEQVQGQTVDGRSDQFSLAVIAFEMLTGDKPYTGEHLTTVVYKIVAEEPLPPHRLNPSLTAAIEAVLRKGLSKRADSRYKNCQEFVEALEKACAGSADWKPLPRGGGLNEPTAVAAAVPHLPPPRVRRGEQPLTGEEPKKRKSGFLTFLLAALALAAVLGLIGWQADPEFPNRWRGFADSIQSALGFAPPAEEDALQPEQTAAPPSNASANPAPGSEPAEAKPSPMPEPEAAVVEEVEGAGEALAPKSESRSAVQPVSIVSSPAGASVTLDGNPNPVCTTPCTLDAAPGRHTLAVTMPGYQVEHRDVVVAGSAVELAPVVLRAPSGTLMLTTEPAGATVSVDGKRMPQATPAKIPLPPGNYTVAVDKDGKHASSSVEIRNGAISYLRIVLP